MKNNSTMDFADWVILIHVNMALLALLTLAFLHPQSAIVAAVCSAVPVMLGTYHFFFVRDQKIPDANPPAQQPTDTQ